MGARGDAVVLRVGEQQLTVREVEERLAALPEFQRARFASMPKLAEKMVAEVLAPELLLATEARRRGLHDTPAGRDRVTAILQEVLLARLREEIAAQRPVTQRQVQDYYDTHSDRFNAPTRIRIWRILVADENVARRIIAAAQAVDGPLKWSELARKHSRDKATAMRKGDLGFVHPDGMTSIPRVRVDAKLYEAAAAVGDGEVVPDPVAEGEHLAVVWRRGTRSAVRQSLDDVRPWIEESLMRERHERAVRKLLDELRKREVKHHDPSALARLDALPIREVRRLPPPVMSAGAAKRGPAPKAGDRGLR